MLTPYGKREWLVIVCLGLLLSALCVFLHLWWILGLIIVAVLALLSFFRDPPRRIPSQAGAMVSPADGRVSSIHQVGADSPLGEPAVCVRIFLSVLDVHVNRSPCRGRVVAIRPKPGRYLNALNPRCAEENETLTLVLHHPSQKRPVAAVRQVAGLIARRIVCAVRVGDLLASGQRYGMIKFGSTTELYVPQSLSPQVQVQKGQRVWGGRTVLATVTIIDPPDPPVAQSNR